LVIILTYITYLYEVKQTNIPILLRNWANVL